MDNFLFSIVDLYFTLDDLFPFMASADKSVYPGYSLDWINNTPENIGIYLGIGGFSGTFANHIFALHEKHVFAVIK